jgi:hypothetical protein
MEAMKSVLVASGVALGSLFVVVDGFTEMAASGVGLLAVGYLALRARERHV